MDLALDRKIVVGFYPTMRVDIPQQVETTWLEFLRSPEMRTHSSKFTKKEDVPAFSPAELEPGKSRAVANVLRVHFGALDIDNSDVDAMHDIAAQLKGISYLLYTTWSYPDRVNFRVLVPFSRAVEAVEWHALWPKLNEHCALGKADPACSNLNRQYLLPAAKGSFLRHDVGNGGEVVDVDTLLSL